MDGIRRTARGLRRLPPLVWVLLIGVVGAGLLATLGGFASAPDHGRPVAPGDEVITQRWRINVDAATLIDDSVEPNDPQPIVRVRLRTEFTGEETLCCMSEGMLEVRYAGQAAATVWASTEDPRSNGAHDPLVESSSVLEFPLDAARLPTTLPDSVEVVVRDERPSRSLILDEWIVTTAVATVRLPCPDERTRR